MPRDGEGNEIKLNARAEIMAAVQELDNAVHGPIDPAELDPQEARERNIQEAIGILKGLVESNKDAAVEFQDGWYEELVQSMNDYNDARMAADEFVRDMKEKMKMPEVDPQQYFYQGVQIEEPQNDGPQNEGPQEEAPQNEQPQQEGPNNEEPQNQQGPNIDENLNIDQEINNPQNQQQNPENQQQNPEVQQPNPEVQVDPNAAEELRQQQEREKEAKRQEIRNALLEVEKALDEPPEPNAEDPLLAQGAKVYGALDKLQTLVNQNPGVCPEFDGGWGAELEARMEQDGLFAAKEFVDSMKEKLGAANAQDVRDAVVNENRENNVNEAVEQAEQQLQQDPRKHYLVLKNPEEEVAEAKPDELAEIKKQRELLQLEMEKLKIEQEKLRLERERLEALKKQGEEKDKEKEKKEPKKEEPEIPITKQRIRKNKKVTARLGIFTEVYYAEDTIRDASSESTKIKKMADATPLFKKSSKSFKLVQKDLNELDKFMQEIKGRTRLSPEEMQTFDRLSMKVYNSCQTHLDRKDKEKEDRLENGKKERKSTYEEKRIRIVEDVQDGVEQIRQKMYKDVIADKIKEMQEKCDLEVAKAEDERNHLSTQNLDDKQLRDTMENNVVRTEFFAHRMKSLKPEDLCVRPGESLGQALGRLDSYLVPRPKDLRDIKNTPLVKSLIDEGVEKTKKGSALTMQDMEAAEKQEIRNQAQPIINQRNRDANIRPVARNNPEQDRRLELNNPQASGPHV